MYRLCTEWFCFLHDPLHPKVIRYEHSSIIIMTYLDGAQKIDRRGDP